MGVTALRGLSVVHGLHDASMHGPPSCGRWSWSNRQGREEHPASALFEKYAHGREEVFSKSRLEGRIAG